MIRKMRRYGWERPFHPLQVHSQSETLIAFEQALNTLMQFVGIALYSILVVLFYTFIGLFVGNRSAKISIISFYSIAAALVGFLFIRCSAIDPTDRSRKKKSKEETKRIHKLNHCFLLKQIVVRFFRKVERKILKRLIRRKYLDPMSSIAQLEPLLPFPLVQNDDASFPDPRSDDVSFCSLCNFEVSRHSKHCNTCNRCVEGFDHHCRWLNNCVGKRNYTTFFLLMVFTHIMLIVELGAAVAVFVRCFADKNSIQTELNIAFHGNFPREALATITIILVPVIAYSSAAIGQLLLFHVVLIRKGMRTYDYILAMKEEAEGYDSESSSDSEEETLDSIGAEELGEKKRVGINAWNLMRLNAEEALASAEKGRERGVKMKGELYRPAPLETASCSPRRRFSGSPKVFVGIMASPKRFGRSLDLKFGDINRDIEKHHLFYPA